MRILLADDSQDNRLLVRAYLKKTPHTVVEVEDGAAALRTFKEAGPFDLILMDVQMPVMDGHAATRAIREWEAETIAQPVPIVALTAHALKEEIQKSLDAGCEEHITKPIRKPWFLELIAGYAQRARADGASVPPGEMADDGPQKAVILVPDAWRGFVQTDIVNAPHG